MGAIDLNACTQQLPWLQSWSHQNLGLVVGSYQNSLIMSTWIHKNQWSLFSGFFVDTLRCLLVTFELLVLYSWLATVSCVGDLETSFGDGWWWLFDWCFFWFGFYHLENHHHWISTWRILWENGWNFLQQRPPENGNFRNYYIWIFLFHFCVQHLTTKNSPNKNLAVQEESVRTLEDLYMLVGGFNPFENY